MEEVSRSKSGLSGAVVDTRVKVVKKKDETPVETILTHCGQPCSYTGLCTRFCGLMDEKVSTKSKGRGRSEVNKEVGLVARENVVGALMELQLEGWALLLLPLAKVEARQETQLWQQQSGRQRRAT